MLPTNLIRWDDTMWKFVNASKKALWSFVELAFLALLALNAIASVIVFALRDAIARLERGVTSET